MGWKKVACWSTQAAISLKCVKKEEKLLWMTYRESQKLSGLSYIRRITRSSLQVISLRVIRRTDRQTDKQTELKT